MPKTLLAVDDSATMRKALEITFSLDDYRVITADGRTSALAKLDEKPDVVVVDTFLDPDDGYALAKEIRGRSPNAFIVMLFSSRFHPYDAAKAAEAGADESIDKPFDTQKFQDLVKNGLVAKAASLTAKPAHVAPAPAPLPAQPPTQVAVPPAPGSSRTLPHGAPPPASGPMRSPTLIDSPAPAPKPAPLSAATAPAPVAAAQPARPAAGIPADFSAKLGQLGLSQAQVEGVLSLSREVIERVVWEVVPTLAEVLIKEEISRLTKEA